MNLPRYLAGSAALLACSLAAHAQYTSPNITSNVGDVSVSLGGMTFINHGIEGVGRISGSTLDSFGETFGSVSSMQITNWSSVGDGSYTGIFNILPDRGYNNNNAGGFFSDYAARLQQVGFSFTPYTGTANIGGTDIGSKIAAQDQISFTSPITGTKFTYMDPSTNTLKPTTGLDPGAAGKTTLFGKTVPYVSSYTGSTFPGAPATTVYNNVNKLALDSEALVLKPDGSGYIGDEYGANVYYFNANKEIVGVITPPAAMQPRKNGSPDFNSLTAVTDGRRNNQGFEGVSLSPDGTKLFALLQSATIQDTNGANQQTRTNTRLVVYDVSGSATPENPTGEYVIQLPTYSANGTGAVSATAAQSEIIVLDDHRLLVLSRDANGQGSATANKSMYKSVLLVDLNGATNIAGTSADGPGAVISPGGALNPSITPVSWVEAVNMLDTAQLEKFNITLDLGGTNQVTKLTLGEKWEGMSLVPANDPEHPDDYFLFVANDNDFLTSNGFMVGPDGTLVPYDAFANHTAVRKPTGPVGSPTIENDTMFIAYRVTMTSVPEPSTFALLGGAAVFVALFAVRRRKA